MVFGRLIRALDRPVDAASTAAFRILFGAVLLLSTLRFIAHGWVAKYYLQPKLFFHYWGFGWVRPLPGLGMYALYAAMAVAALAITVGFAYRLAASLFALAFSYAHLCDKTNYLNHYYLISLLAGLLVVLPLDGDLSVRAWRRPSQRRGRVRAWVLYALRFQIAVVYVFGGLGKLGSDWLLEGEPLRVWLSANAGLPLLGPLLSAPWAALAFSWSGALFDLSIVPLLLWRRTRASAYAVLVTFHVLTALLFPIGMFPWLMIACTPIFWEPSWPRALLERAGRQSLPADAVAGGKVGRAGQLAASLYAAAQILLPLRSFFYPGNTLWTEEGFRFSWKVMLIEKAGELELKVVDARGRSYLVDPRVYLTPLQTRMAVTQPDMIQELAADVARDYGARGYGPVRVYADSHVSLNGRLRQRFVDPDVDLATQSDGLGHPSWILPAPTTAPSF